MKQLFAQWICVVACVLLPSAATAARGSFASVANGCEAGLLGTASVDCGSLQGFWKVEVDFDNKDSVAKATSIQNRPGRDKDSDSISGTVKVTRVITSECAEGCKATKQLPTKTKVTFTGLFSGTLLASQLPAPGGGDYLALAEPTFNGPAGFDLEALAITVNDTSPFNLNYTSTVELGEGTYEFSAGVLTEAFVPVRTNGGAQADASFSLAVNGGGDFSIPCVPEPSSVAMAVAGLGALATRIGRRRRHTTD